MNGLTVLHVNTEAGYRGGEIQNLHLAAGIDRAGGRSILAVQEGSGLGARGRELGLDVRERPMRGEFDPWAASWLASLTRRERPDVVHYHTSHAVTLGTLGRLRRRCGPPAVATRRTSFPTRRNPLFRLKFTFRLEHLIAVSGSIRDDVVAAGIPADRVSVVHSGIDLERYTPDRLAGAGREFRREIGVPDDAPLLGCVGALAPQKGQRALVRVMANLAHSFPSLHLVLVGEGELGDAIRGEAAAHGVGGRVHLTGFRDDVPRLVSAFDVAVLNSTAGEGSPAAVKEGMALGVPVVASDIGGVRELLQHDREGILVGKDDAAGLQEALRRLLADPGLRRRMGAAGRRRAQEFSMPKMVEHTVAVYLRVCGAGEGSLRRVPARATRSHG